MNAVGEVSENISAVVNGTADGFTNALGALGIADAGQDVLQDQSFRYAPAPAPDRTAFDHNRRDNRLGQREISLLPKLMPPDIQLNVREANNEVRGYSSMTHLSNDKAESMDSEDGRTAMEQATEVQDNELEGEVKDRKHHAGDDPVVSYKFSGVNAHPELKDVSIQLGSMFWECRWANPEYRYGHGDEHSGASKSKTGAAPLESIFWKFTDAQKVRVPSRAIECTNNNSSSQMLYFWLDERPQGGAFEARDDARDGSASVTEAPNSIDTGQSTEARGAADVTKPKQGSSSSGSHSNLASASIRDASLENKNGATKYTERAYSVIGNPDLQPPGSIVCVKYKAESFSLDSCQDPTRKYGVSDTSVFTKEIDKLRVENRDLQQQLEKSQKQLAAAGLGDDHKPGEHTSKSSTLQLNHILKNKHNPKTSNAEVELNDNVSYSRGVNGGYNPSIAHLVEFNSDLEESNEGFFEIMGLSDLFKWASEVFMTRKGQSVR